MRRLIVILCLLLAIGGLHFFIIRPGCPIRPISVSPTSGSQSPIPNPPSAIGNQWGGALNSASEDGAGFFDRQAARNFAAAVEPELRKYIVELNARAFLPLAGQAVSLPAQTESLRYVVYLQFKDQLTDAQRRDVAQQGIELLGYVAGCAWTARGTAEAFRAALRLDFVRAVARIDPRDKLHPLVFEISRGRPAPAYALASGGRARFMFLALPGTTAAALSRQLAAQPPLAALEAMPAAASVLGPRFEIAAASELAPQIAALDSAAFVGLVPPPAAPRDATTDRISNIDDIRDAPPNLSGANVKVAVREIGKVDAHADFASRLIIVDNDGNTSASNVNHSTGVVGQLGSNGQTQPSAKGVAPAVNMLLYSLNNDAFTTADILDAVTKGARLSNHSYGPSGLSAFGDYDPISADWDAAMRNNDLLGTFASNEEVGGQFKHIDFFVGAKNTICVTANSATANAGDDNPLMPKSDGIATFCEFGPMNDGRVKPDLSAFGESVTLCAGTSSTQTNSGTSFSTPAVCGVAALVFEQYRAALGREPSAALTKALLCNSATDLGRAGPDATYGFGIVNAEEAVATINRRAPPASPFLEDSVTHSAAKVFTVDVQSVPQLKATLCWMDPAGNPAAAKALVNDLDLVLEAPDGKRFMPFSLDPLNPGAVATNTVPNTVDPIEQIVVDNPVNGLWYIFINGSNIPEGAQSFAVVLNRPALPPPLSAVISASPENGPAPLTVSFSAAESTGQPSKYSWTFGDGSTLVGGPELVNVQHTYTAAGSYTVTLTLDDTASATRVIQVTKRLVSAFAGRLRALLDFRADESFADDDLTFSLIAPELARTSLQARADVAAGVFLGKTYTVQIGGSADGSIPATRIATVVLDEKARFRTPDLLLTLNLVKGEFRFKLRDEYLESIFRGSGMTRDPASNGLYELPVEVEGPDAIYRAIFRVLYKPNPGRNGIASALW